jgi:hypothetical protein
MVNLLNVSYKEFRENIKNKKLVLWGAGRLASYYIGTFCANLDIDFIVDSNDKVCGKNIEVDGKSYAVISEKDFIQKLNHKIPSSDKIALFVTPTAYAGEILEHVNEIDELNGVDCYLGVILRERFDTVPFEFSKGKPKIPKKIHYCWFGGKEIPYNLKNTWNHGKKIVLTMR